MIWLKVFRVTQCVCVFLLLLPSCEPFTSHLSLRVIKKKWGGGFQQGVPFIFSLPLQWGNQERVWKHQKARLHWVGLNWPTFLPPSAPCRECVRHNPISGVWACVWAVPSRAAIPGFTKGPISSWWSQEKERVRGLWGQTKRAFATEHGIDHQQPSLSPSSQAVGLAFCQPCSEKPC